MTGIDRAERALGPGLLARWVVVVILIAGLPLPGCGPGEQEKGAAQAPSAVAGQPSDSRQNMPTPGVTDEVKASRPWRIAFLMKAEASTTAYWARAAQAAERAERDFGVSVTIYAPPGQDAVEAQIKTMDELVRRHRTDGVVIAPVDTNRLSPVVEKAIAAGIPVIVYDTPLNAEGMLTFVGFNNVLACRLLGRWVVDRLGGRGNVLILEGLAGHQNGIERRNGFMEGLREGDIDILALESGRWLKPEAKRIVAGWLQRFSRIDAIMAASDDMALGAADAVREAHREGIVITGFDANRDALLAIRKGRMHATIDQVPERLVRQALQVMLRHLESGAGFPPTLLWHDIRLITPENVDQFLP